jgi:hypothetical protein
MVDYAIDIYKNLNGTDTAPEEMLQQKEKVYINVSKNCAPDASRFTIYAKIHKNE